MDPDVNYGRANFVRKHVYVLAGSAELPYGKGRGTGRTPSGPLTAILGGWQLNAAATIMSGLPFNVSYRDSGAGPRHRPRPSGPDRRSGRGQRGRADDARTST